MISSCWLLCYCLKYPRVHRNSKMKRGDLIMHTRNCITCSREFQPQRNPYQLYCSDEACQQRRYREWQAQKRQRDGDYRENEKRVQKKWHEAHAGYYRRYRELHPDYAERNRQQTKQRYHANKIKQKKPKQKSSYFGGDFK